MMVMQDSGADGGIDPKKIHEWRLMLYRHTHRRTLGTVAVPDPDDPEGWIERAMLNVVFDADRAEVRDARELLEEALPLVRGFIERIQAQAKKDGFFDDVGEWIPASRKDHPAVVTARKIREFLNG